MQTVSALLQVLWACCLLLLMPRQYLLGLPRGQSTSQYGLTRRLEIRPWTWPTQLAQLGRVRSTMPAWLRTMSLVISGAHGKIQRLGCDDSWPVRHVGSECRMRVDVVGDKEARDEHDPGDR